MTEHPAAPTTPEEWLRRLIGPSEPDGLGDENQHWRNHPEWPDDEGMLLGCTVGDLRQIAALIEAEARSTPAEALDETARENWRDAVEVLRDALDVQRTGCVHEGIGKPGCRICDPRTYAYRSSESDR